MSDGHTQITQTKPKAKCICGRASPGGCEVRGCYFPSSPRWRKHEERN